MTGRTRSGLTTPRERRAHGPISGALLAVLLVGCVSPAAAELRHDLFEPYEVDTGPAPGQTLLTGFFLGGPVADLAVVQVSADGERLLRLYGFQGDGWLQHLEATLGRDVSFVDVAEVAGRDRLVTYRGGRLHWFDPESASERRLVEAATRFNSAPSGLRYGGFEPQGPFDEGEVPRIDVFRDLNGDGRDDLVLPDVDGFHVSIQRGDGSFAEPLKIGPPEPFRDELAYDETRSYGEVGLSALTIPLYLSRVHALDHDRDGRLDLVFWNGDHFEVHRQDEHGLFEPAPETFTVDVPFDADGAYALAFGFADAGSFRLLFGLRKKSRRTVLHSFQEVNGDGIADLVTLSLEGRSLLRLRTFYEVHFGAPTPDGTTFRREAGATLRPGGLGPLGYSTARFEDLDGDGQPDLAAARVKTGIGKMIRALVGKSVTLEFELHPLEGGVPSGEAVTRRRVRTAFRPLAGRDAGFFPAAMGGDVNGDGRADLLVGASREELRVFFGTPGPELLERRPRCVAVALPGDERNSWLVDLNRDGKEDLLLHHPSATGSHRVKLLVAR